MTRPDVFTFHTSQDFLKSMITYLGRGTQSRLAEAMACQPGYLTRILQGRSGLSLEQAENACQFFNLDEDEQRFFFTLVEKDRASTVRLKKFFTNEERLLREKRNNLKNRYDVEHTISEEAVMAYFNDWKKIAVHSAVVLPGNQTPETIASRLEIPVAKVAECLKFLSLNGFIRTEKGKYVDSLARIHLGSDSVMIEKHHTNWRLQALRAIDRNLNQNLHYSSLVTISHKDLELVKSLLIQTLDRVKAVIRDSKDETLAVLNLDFFEM